MYIIGATLLKVLPLVIIGGNIMYCPIRPAGSAGGIRDCYGSHCVFADGKGGCLIADALALYVEEKERKKNECSGESK